MWKWELIKRNRCWNLSKKGIYPRNLGPNICRVFRTVFLHHKWYGTKLLSPKSKWMFKLLRKLQKIPSSAWIWWRVPSWPPERQMLIFLPKNCEKSAIKHSIEKPNLLNLMNLSKIHCPRLPFAKIGKWPYNWSFLIFRTFCCCSSFPAYKY